MVYYIYLLLKFIRVFFLFFFVSSFFFFFQAEDGIRDHCVTGVQTCALPISEPQRAAGRSLARAGRQRLPAPRAEGRPRRGRPLPRRLPLRPRGSPVRPRREIGRASCRERV